MNILCDFHHSDLWWSSHLIFEVALGHRLYRPRGMEWFEKGYYQKKNHDVAKQFLIHSMFTLEDVAKYPSCKVTMPPGSFHEFRASMDTLNGCRYYPLIRTVSLEEFADLKIDIIMPTLSENQEPWLRLRNNYQPKAKLIREEGNVCGWSAIHPDYKNLLTSDLPTFKKANTPNKLLYHQRFDTQRIFAYRDPKHFDRVTCFMPGLRGSSGLMAFIEKHDFGSMEFVDYGHHSPRGFLSPKEKYVEELYRTAFVWHVKPGGDGFGHVIHNGFAVGRPVITNGDDYRDSQVWPLLEDGKTCILIGRDHKENSEKIKSMSHPDMIKQMSKLASERFRQVVNYDMEANEIKRFLERLV